MSKKQSVLVLGDLHMPYHDKARLKEVINLAKLLQPTHIVQVGDIYDQYTFSRYAKSLNLTTPQDEWFEARRYGEELWDKLGKACPDSTKKLLKGNHDDRIVKQLYNRLPELAEDMVKHYVHPKYVFKGVDTMRNSQQHLDLRINGERIRFHHGFLSKLGDHMRKWLCSTVVGHSHRPGILYDQVNNRGIYEANAGYLGDKKARVFNYGESETKNWVRGVLWINEYGPQFINLE
jgi:predicted phosphodiesterase